MKKIIKRKSSSVPEQDEQDIAALINKMQEQLVSLEKKIDTLISRPSEKPAEEKHFSKPFQRFDRPRHHDRGDRDNSFRRDRSDRDNGFRERNFTKVTCSDCNKECEVPFKPSGDRPVYCKECFAKRKEDRPQHKENYDNKPREQIFIPERHSERHFDKQKSRGDRKPGKRKESGFRKRK